MRETDYLPWATGTKVCAFLVVAPIILALLILLVYTTPDYSATNPEAGTVKRVRSSIPTLASNASPAPAIDPYSEILEDQLKAAEVQASILDTQNQIIGAINQLSRIVAVYMIYNE